MGKGSPSPQNGTAPAGNTTTTQTTQPWSQQIPFLTGSGSGVQGNYAGGPVTNPAVVNPSNMPGVLPAAAGLYQNYTPQYFPNSTVSPFTGAQQAGLGQLENFGISGGSPAVNNAAGQIANIENGDYLSAGNPYFSGMVNSIQNAVAPGINSMFANANRYGSNANQQAVASAVTNAAAPLAMQNYQQGLSNMLQGAYVAPNLQQAQLAPANALLTAGGTEQAQNQAQLNDQIQRFNYNQMLPYNQLNAYEGAVSGNYGGTSTLTQPYFQNQTAGKLGNAAGGAALGKGLGSSLFGQGGSTAGGIAGGLGGLALSDRRVKRDIEALFKLGNGLTVYRFRYHDNDNEQLGFMADEVQLIHPEAVSIRPDGLSQVDYWRAAA